MLIKNISEKTFNLESGCCNPGEIAEATYKESVFLIDQQKLATVYIPEDDPAMDKYGPLKDTPEWDALTRSQKISISKKRNMVSSND